MGPTEKSQLLDNTWLSEIINKNILNILDYIFHDSIITEPEKNDLIYKLNNAEDYKKDKDEIIESYKLIITFINCIEYGKMDLLDKLPDVFNLGYERQGTAYNITENNVTASLNETNSLKEKTIKGGGLRKTRKIKNKTRTGRTRTGRTRTGRTRTARKRTGRTRKLKKGGTLFGNSNMITQT